MAGRRTRHPDHDVPRPRLKRDWSRVPEIPCAACGGRDPRRLRRLGVLDPAGRIGYHPVMRRSRRITVHTWDYGDVTFDPHADPELARRLLQKFLDNEMWDQIRRFPASLIAKCAPRLNAPCWSRRFLELCAEEWS